MLHRNEFTAGPWAVDRVPIESQGGSNTCFRIGPMVACIYDDWRARERGISEEQQIANANLIAAAPEMYEALEEAVSLVHSAGDEQEDGAAQSGPEFWHNQSLLLGDVLAKARSHRITPQGGNDT